MKYNTSTHNIKAWFDESKVSIKQKVNKAKRLKLYRLAKLLTALYKCNFAFSFLALPLYWYSTDVLDCFIKMLLFFFFYFFSLLFNLWLNFKPMALSCFSLKPKISHNIFETHDSDTFMLDLNNSIFNIFKPMIRANQVFSPLFCFWLHQKRPLLYLLLSFFFLFSAFWSRREKERERERKSNSIVFGFWKKDPLFCFALFCAHI